MTNFIDQIKAAESAKLRALASLHTELGYGSAAELAAAIRGASGGARTATARSPIAAPSSGNAVAASKATPAAPSKTRKGRRIDEDTKRQIVAALKSGEPGARVAKQLGVSYPTIHNWKTELGLVKPRGGARKSNKK
jgi:DNA-binding NarL/FixJ family response regulator